MGAKAKGLDDEDRLCAAVVCAVEDRADGQAEGGSEFVAGSYCACGHAYTHMKMRG